MTMARAHLIDPSVTRWYVRNLKGHRNLPGTSRDRHVGLGMSVLTPTSKSTSDLKCLTLMRLIWLINGPVSLITWGLSTLRPPG